MKAVSINPTEVFKTIQENLDSLRSVDYSQLSKVEKEEMREELLEVRELALSIKKRMDEQNDNFLLAYFAESSRVKQLSMMKDYMLSLSPEELTEFVKEPIRFLGEALQSNEVSEESKASIFEKLDELTFLLSGRAVAST
ncbi:MAG: hypothetical protein IT258_24050 [Saprospiraceae bacterium]|nr:hypothetical protein [Saprospiraceae bacterium]